MTLFRLPGYVGGEPAQPVPRDVVAAMAPRADGQAEGWVVDFWVADLEATVARAGELGGCVVAAPSESPAAGSAVLADPAGAVFSVTRASGG